MEFVFLLDLAEVVLRVNVGERQAVQRWSLVDDDFWRYNWLTWGRSRRNNRIRFDDSSQATAWPHVPQRDS